MKRFAAGLLSPPARFWTTSSRSPREVAARRRAGEALGQLLLKLTCPGVPDVYGGDELWFLALVDPDNRRPVDFAARRAALASLRDAAEPTARDA